MTDPYSIPGGQGGWGAPPPQQQQAWGGQPQQNWGAPPAQPVAPQQGPADLGSADEFMSGGVKSASFGKNGHSIRGGEIPGPIGYEGEIIAEPFMQQQRDMDTGALQWWPAERGGGPMKQMVLHIRTDQRDPSDPNDDGTRALYAKGNMANAIREAVRQAGASGAPRKGGWIRVEYYDDDLGAKKNNKSAPKLFRSKYRQPDAFAGTTDPGVQQQYQQPPQQDQGGWGAAPPAAPVAPAAPAYAPPPQQPPAGVPQYTPEMLATLPDQAIAALKAAGQIDPNWQRP